jgi:hypothetical protein
MTRRASIGGCAPGLPTVSSTLLAAQLPLCQPWTVHELKLACGDTATTYTETLQTYHCNLLGQAYMALTLLCLLQQQTCCKLRACNRGTAGFSFRPAAQFDCLETSQVVGHRDCCFEHLVTDGAQPCTYCTAAQIAHLLSSHLPMLHL